MIRKIAAAAALFALTLANQPAYALDDELSVGQEIYERRCAACHGETGMGDGIMSDLFKVRPAALSQLSKENDGEFPFELVYQTLKATEELPGHGPTAMPVWGDFFMVEHALRDTVMSEAEAYAVIGKMLSVVYYIETLQEE